MYSDSCALLAGQVQTMWLPKHSYTVGTSDEVQDVEAFTSRYSECLNAVPVWFLSVHFTFKVVSIIPNAEEVYV
jgi:hypothetical protein